MHSQPQLPLWKKLSFSAVFIALIFGVLEGILWLAGFDYAPRQASRERIWGNKGVGQDPALPWSWMPLPGATCSIGGKPAFQFNEQGFRGAVVTKEKPADVFRIVCLGDSCALGWGVSDNETYCFQLSALLQPVLHKKVETINGGVLGYTSAQGLHELQTRILELKPDLVTISYNWNDHAPAISLQGMDYTAQSKPDNELPRTDMITRVALNASQLRSYQLVQWIVAGSTKDLNPSSQEEDPEYEVSEIPEKLRVPLHYYTQNLKEMVRIARENKIIPLLITQPYQPSYSTDRMKQFFVEKQQEYNAALLKVAEETGAPFVDMAAVLAASDQPPKKLFDGRVHPTAKGHRIIAKTLTEKIASLMQQ